MLVDGTTFIADSLSDLLDGTLAAPINVTELGTRVTGYVWTNTWENGTDRTGGSFACSNWTSGSNAVTGIVGNSTLTSGWSAQFQTFCSIEHRLFCFEN